MLGRFAQWSATKPPSLSVKLGELDTPLKIDCAHVSVAVNGPFYEVTQTLTFEATDTKIEGQLAVPFPEGAVVCGFAVKIGDEMVDAAVVGKAKAKKAFEKEVRSGGPTAVLIEHSAGNVYKTRIWPLEPGVQKTIQITWSSSVASDDSASSAASVAVEDRSAGWKAGLGTLPSNLLRDTLVWLNAQEMFPAARSCRALWRSVASGLLVVPLPYGGGVASSLSVELNLNSNRARKDVATPSWGLPLLANDAAATAGGAADDENKNTLSADVNAAAIATDAATRQGALCMAICLPQLIGTAPLLLTESVEKVAKIGDTETSDEASSSTEDEPALSYDSYFAVLDTPPPSLSTALAPAPTAGAVKSVGRVAAVHVVWDASYSRARNAGWAEGGGSASKAEAKCVGALLAEFGDDVAVSVSALRSDLEERVYLADTNTSAQRDEVVGLLTSRLTPDGATNFGALDLLATTPFKRSTKIGADDLGRTVVILISDGLSTIGERLPKNLDSKSTLPRVVVLTAAKTKDTALLRHIATKTDGVFATVSSSAPEASATSVADELRGNGLRFVGMEFDDAQLFDVVPSVGALGAVSASARIGVAGRLCDGVESATIGLKYVGVNGVTRTNRYQIQRSPSCYTKKNTTSGVVSRFHAQQFMAPMLAAPDVPAHQEQILALGRRFGLVTPQTSLLLLETLTQHMEHGILPAKSRAAMREEFIANQLSAMNQIAGSRASKLNAVKRMWGTHKQWWSQTVDIQKFEERAQREADRLQKLEDLSHAVELDTWLEAAASANMVYGNPRSHPRLFRGAAAAADNDHILAADIEEMMVVALSERTECEMSASSSMSRVSSAAPEMQLQRVSLDSSDNDDECEEEECNDDDEYAGGAPAPPPPAASAPPPRPSAAAAPPSGSVPSPAASPQQGPSSTMKMMKKKGRKKKPTTKTKSVAPAATDVVDSDQAKELASSSGEEEEVPIIPTGPPVMMRMASYDPAFDDATGAADEDAPAGASGKAAAGTTTTTSGATTAGTNAEEGEEGGALPSTIAVTPWKPNDRASKQVVMCSDDAATKGDDDHFACAQTKYFELRNTSASRESPSFFLAVSNAFKRVGDDLAALGGNDNRRNAARWYTAAQRCMSCVVEIGHDDASLNRIVAYALDAAESTSLALSLFQRVQQMRPFEPQSARDTANTLVRNVYALMAKCVNSEDPSVTPEDVLAAVPMMRDAVELLENVLLESWDSRYSEIEITALTELNNLLGAIDFVEGVTWAHAVSADAKPDLRTRAEIRAHGGSDAAALEELEADGTKIRLRIPAELVENLTVDLRVSLAWDTDDVDIDLHVNEKLGSLLPGEHAYYSHNRTVIGGKVSRDFTKGYGPEEYNLRVAPPGEYTVSAKYYGSSKKSKAGATSALLSLFTDYGRPTQRRKMITLRLDTSGGVVPVGSIVVRGGPRSVKKKAAEAAAAAEEELSAKETEAGRITPPLSVLAAPLFTKKVKPKCCIQ